MPASLKIERRTAMIYIVRKSIRRTGRVVLEKFFDSYQFRNPEQAEKAAFDIALAEDRAKKDTEMVQLLAVSEITSF
jgi:hypothetical protein